MGDLGQAGAPVAAREPPGARPGQRLAQVREPSSGGPVGVARAGDQRRGAEQHLAVEPARQVGAQEGQLGVRHGIDVRAHEVGALGSQAQVGAPKRHDPRLDRGSGGDREPIRPGTGADDDGPRSSRATVVAHLDSARQLVDPLDGAADRDHAAARGQLVGVCRCDLPEVDDSGARRVQPGDPGHVRLDLAQLAGRNRVKSRHAVLDPAALELGEPPELALAGRDDQLARAQGGDPALLAVGVELGGAGDAESRLQRPRLVVDPGVDHPAGVAGLVGADLALALEHADREAVVAKRELAGCRETDDPGADDDQIAFARRLGHGCETSRA